MYINPNPPEHDKEKLAEVERLIRFYTKVVCSRALAIRMNFNLPKDFPSMFLYPTRRAAITLFFEGLRQKIEGWLARHNSPYSCPIVYAWGREITDAMSMKEHWHSLIIANKDVFYRLGDYRDSESLYYLIASTWCDTFGLPYFDEYLHLASVSSYGTEWVDSNSREYEFQIAKVLSACTYIVKYPEVVVDDGKRCFGRSKIPSSFSL